MKTDYNTVAMIRAQLDNSGKGGFMRMANAYLDGNFDKALAWRYMRDVFNLPRHLFDDFLHHFRVAVETEVAWRRKEALPLVVQNYLAGATLKGME